MALNSGIEWTEATWNPVTGCDKISSGCKYCYAAVLSKRLQAMGQYNYRNNFQITLQPQMLEIPYKWKKQKIVFVNSMSDLFHDDIPLDYIKRVFEVMNNTQHIYQILTKRHQRLSKIADKLNWTKNIWMGVTVESQIFTKRIPYLLQTPAYLKFLSIEPLISEISKIELNNIDWVIVGGESGPNARPIKAEWVRYLRDSCIEENIPFFFKQWGGKNKKTNGKILDGKIWQQMPNTKEFSIAV